MRKKVSQKITKENPNQLTFEFLYKDPSINVHIPKTSVTKFDTYITTTSKLSIKLARS
jgi:hypothetical protein